MGFKEKLKEKRVEANLTQVQLAEKISVTARTIQNYELGTRKPTKNAIVEQLASALNTTAEYLLVIPECSFSMHRRSARKSCKGN
jgi:transcriptional regulator with XRE-family HTH domain